MKIGMEHNPDLTDDQDASLYLQRNLIKQKDSVIKIVRDEEVGRHVVAARNIKAGEVVMKEAPLSYGPNDITKPICLSCCAPVTIKSPTCDICGFPMCSKECINSKVHKEFECEALKRHGYKVDASTFNFGGVELTYAIISPIRTFMLREKYPDLWNLTWMQMSHLDKRKKLDFWKTETEKIINLLQIMTGLKDEDIPIIEAILGIHLVNDFEISLQDKSTEEISTNTSEHGNVRGLFALNSMPNHDCLANTTHTFGSSKEDFAMTVKALRDIKAGEDITHSYAEPMNTVLARQTILQMGKFFHCGCKRCSDPTELGTYSSALKCPKCKKGDVISSDTKRLDSMWNCSACNAGINPDKISLVTKAVKEAADRLDVNPKVDEFEAFLKKYSAVLHQNHVILIDKKYTLAKMYGRMQGYEPDKMSDEQFRRKLQLCEEVLKVLDKIMPGQSRKRGMIKYELHLPLVMLTNKQLQNGPDCGVSPDELKNNLKRGLDNLKESLEILKNEPQGSFESKIVEGSKDSVTQLEQWVGTVCSSI